MKIKKELQAVCAGFGVKTGGYQSTWEEIQALAVAHSVGAVVRDFTNWMNENQGDDFPYGAVSKYLQVASGRLSAETTPLAVVANDPNVVSLLRDLTYLSGDKVTFQGRHKPAIAELLKEYSKAELTSVFRTYIADKDLDDPYILKFVAQNFLEAADALAYSSRRRKQEAEQAKTERDAAVLRLQAEAEAERQEAVRRQQEEATAFDPLSDG